MKDLKLRESEWRRKNKKITEEDNTMPRKRELGSKKSKTKRKKDLDLN
jgi:hypothetical protein